MFIYLWTESYFSDRLTFSNIHGKSSRIIYILALPLRAPEFFTHRVNYKNGKKQSSRFLVVLDVRTISSVDLIEMTAMCIPRSPSRLLIDLNAGW